MDSIGARFMNQNIDVDGFRRILSLKLVNPSKGNVLRAVAALEQREDVYSAEPDYIYQVDIPVETQSTNSQAVSVFGWGAGKIDQEAAWEIETGSYNVRVGVLDTGIDITHSELSGKVSISLSRDFVTDDYSEIEDPLGHGTHVAGIIAAKHNNDSLNFSGVCQNVTLVSLSVIKRIVTIDEVVSEVKSSVLTNAINYAETKNIPLLNLSLDVTNNDEPGMLIEAISNYTGLIIQAAGNSGEYFDSADITPAYWDSDNIIIVGASTSSDAKWEDSNYGASVVDLFAPGENIVSCYPRSKCASSGCTASHASYGYHFFSGTSMATPFVTGVAALILARHPNATPATIKNTIIDSDDDVSTLSGLCYSGGRLNAYNALMSKILHSDVTYTSINATYHQVSCNDCDLTWQEAHAERPGVEVCIYCQEYL